MFILDTRMFAAGSQPKHPANAKHYKATVKPAPAPVATSLQLALGSHYASTIDLPPSEDSPSSGPDMMDSGDTFQASKRTHEDLKEESKDQSLSFMCNGVLIVDPNGDPLPPIEFENMILQWAARKGISGQEAVAFLNNTCTVQHFVNHCYGLLNDPSLAWREPEQELDFEENSDNEADGEGGGSDAWSDDLDGLELDGN
jgi:hypothetical protein